MIAKTQSSGETPRMEAYDDVFDALYSDDPDKATEMKLRSDELMRARASAPAAAYRQRRLGACRSPRCG